MNVYYTLKLYCNNNMNPPVLNEMKNEANIYQYLNPLDPSDFYIGMMFFIEIFFIVLK
jgi:hypothetical protein